MAEKQKILYVITKSNWGGAQRYVYDLATSLPQDRFEVVVAMGGSGQAGTDTGLLAEKLKTAGIKTIFVKSFRRDISVWQDLKTLPELYSIFKTERPSVVHLNSSKAGFVGALAGRLAGVPKIIFTAHGWVFNEARPAWQLPIIKFITWLTIILCHKIITINKKEKSQVINWPGVKDKVITIYNGIAPMAFESGDKIRSAFPVGVKITGTIGELTNNKNQIALIEEVKNNPEMYVAIVGTGENHEMLFKKIKEYDLEDSVKLLGFIPASEALKGFDTFALPSLKEGLPYVLLEAKAAGLPITANPVGGIPEILDPKNTIDFSLDRMVRETSNLYK